MTSFRLITQVGGGIELWCCKTCAAVVAQFTYWDPDCISGRYLDGVAEHRTWHERQDGHETMRVQLRTENETSSPPIIIDSRSWGMQNFDNYSAIIGDHIMIVKNGKTIYAGPIADMPCRGCEHPPHVGRVCGHPLFETFRDDVGIFAPPSGMKITDIVGTCQCEFESNVT